MHSTALFSRFRGSVRTRMVSTTTSSARETFQKHEGQNVSVFSTSSSSCKRTHIFPKTFLIFSHYFLSVHRYLKCTRGLNGRGVNASCVTFLMPLLWFYSYIQFSLLFFFFLNLIKGSCFVTSIILKPQVYSDYSFFITVSVLLLPVPVVPLASV